MIELDIVIYDMFHLPPVSEYELYVKKFGSDGTRQVAVQTGEDNLEVDTQTEPISMSTIWVQWPPEDLKGYGREEEGGEEDLEVTSSASASKMEESALKLGSFLKKAGQVNELYAMNQSLY